MKRWIKWSLAGAGVLAVAARATAGGFEQKTDLIGSGYVSKYLCASTFIFHKDTEAFIANVLAALPA